MAARNSAKGASKGRFRRTGEARRVATAAEKLTGTLQMQVLPPRRPPQSLHARTQLQSSARASPLCAAHFPRHFPRVGAHKMAVLSRQSTSRKSKGTPRSVESIRTGRACPSSSGLKRISEKEAGQGASWMSKKRQDDPNAACSTRLQQAEQPSRQRRSSVRGLHVPPVGGQ